MARKLFILALFLMAASIGVLCYQILDCLIVGSWPAVPVKILWEDTYGPAPDMSWQVIARAVEWVGALPMVLAGLVFSYCVFLISDSLRRF